MINQLVANIKEDRSTDCSRIRSDVELYSGAGTEKSVRRIW